MTMAPENFPEFRLTVCSRPNANTLTLRWSIAPTAYPLEDIRFVVFRSNGPKGPWEEVGVAEEGAFTFTDFDVRSVGVHRNYYYIVRAASVSQKGFRDSKPFVLEHDPDHIALELVRKKNVFLRVNGGISLGVLIKKTWGSKCSRCYNTQKQLPSDPDCPSCYGTGFSGGFMNPAYIPGLMNPPRKVITDAGIEFDPQAIYSETANTPIISVKDVVVDRKMNIRYTVENVAQSARRMHLVSQILTLLRIDENSILYTIDIPEPPHADEGRSFDQEGANDDPASL
jgi:hypothetical protein